MAGRTLEDVFDYFVPPEEQRAARAKSPREPAPPGSRPAPAPPASPRPVRWCLAVDPARLLHAALAADLACGLARDGREAFVASSFARPRLAPRIDWRVAPRGELGPLLDRHPDAHVIVALPACEVAETLVALGASRFDGVALATDPRPGGLREALGQLRRMRAPAGLRIGTILVGAAPGEAQTAFRKLEGAARRQLGRGPEALGAVQVDDAGRRALMRGQPTLELGDESASARQVLELCARLCAAPREAA